MRIKFPIKTKIAGLVTTTFLLIVLALSLYLFVVIRNNERQIINRSFRTLVQIGENIKDKNTTYVKIVANNTKIEQDSTGENKTKDEKIEEDEIKRLIKADMILYRVNPELYPVIPDSLFINPEDSVKEVSKEEFFNSLVREDIFDAFIIRTGDTVIFNSENLDIKLNPDYRKDSTAWQAGDVDLVTIGAIDYKRFSLPLKMDEKDWWYIDGLIENSTFQSEKKSLGTWFVIIMFILFVFIILSFPVLRLFLMSSIEQMHRSNLFLAGTSVIIGSSLITILLISMLSNNEIQSIRKQRLKMLADTIHKEFVNELNSIYAQMKYYDSLDSVYFNNDILLADSIIRKQDSLVYLPQKYSNYKTMFWMDSRGQQIQELKLRQGLPNLINLGYRNYFKKRDAWQLPGCENKDSSCRFMIESIYSNTSGDALAAVSARSTGEKWFFNNNLPADTTYQPIAMAMTAPMYSIMDPILPKGYSFSIIGPEGKVWFHSNKHRNLQENLLDECSRNSKLESVIFSRIPENLRLNYQNKDYRAYVLPIRNIPLLIVTMEESSLINSYNSTIVSLSFLFIIASLLFLGIQVFILKITDREETKLKLRKYTLEWLLPQISNTQKYFSLMIGHFLVLISLLFLFVFSDENKTFLLDAFFILLYVQLFITEKARYELKNDTQPVKSGIFSFFKKMKKDTFSFIVLFIFLLFNIVHSKISENYILFLFFQFWIVLLLTIPWLKIISNLLKTKKENTGTVLITDKHFFITFQLFIITWLFIISFFPAIVFFQKSLMIERNINRKYQQLHLVYEFQTRNNNIDSYFARNNINDTENHDYRNQRKSKGIYTHFAGITIREAKDSCSGCSKLPNYYSDSLLMNMRPLYSTDNIENRKLIFNTGTDFNWQLKKAEKECPPAKYDSLFLRFNSSEILAKDSLTNKPYLISASRKRETILGGYGINTLIFWVLLSCAILFIYKLMENVLKRIFPFSAKSETIKMPFGDLLKTVSQTTDWPAFTFAINLSGKDSASRKTEAEKLGFKCFEVSRDMYYPDNFHKEDKIVILNFGFILRSSKLFDQCINLLEDLINKKVQKIVISSYVSPRQIKEFYKNYIQKTTSGNEQEKLLANLNRINQLLMEFSVINCSLQPSELKPAENEKIPELVKRELKNDMFLASLKPMVMNYYKKNTSANDEDIIIYIQNLAANYYEKIWNSCTIEEKILIFDLAEDSLVNIKNYDAFVPLRNLQEKGIVVCENKFGIMNESFRNYILTNIQKSELEATELMKNRKSAWNSFRIPLILFASGIVIFLFATQQALISNLYTLIIAVGTIAGVFIKVSGMFSSKSKTPAEVKNE